MQLILRFQMIFADTVISDSKDSTVTYTIVSSLFGGLSDIRSSGVDGPPVMPEDPYAYVVAAFQAPPSPDYVPGPEYPPSPDFVPKPVYPKFMPPEDEEDLEEDNDDPEEDPADYPADERDNGDDEDESSDDDKDDDDVDIEGDDEEEDHPAPADSTAVALLAVDHAPSAEETEPFETDESAATPPPHPAYRVTARISIQDEPPTPFWSDTEVARLLAFTYPLQITSFPHGIAIGLRYEVGESSSARTARPPGGFQVDYGFVSTMDSEIMPDLERDVGYGITDTWDEMLVDMLGAPATDDT
ncbi:hypothetical protein Tco_0456014 [Tanacetum coccineum]